VVQARCAEDVVAAVRFAGAHGLTVGVQATGHGAVSSLAGHVLVSTRELDEVTVHVEERWARVGAGVKWSGLVPHVAPHGLAGVSGSTTDVGIVGYTTGGGVGPMARTHGIHADKVRAIEVVTGDGEFRRVTPTEHPDLFFALRGGKGAAGIITAIEFDLIEMPTFYGGSTFFDAPDIAAVLDAWRHWSERLPEAGTTSVAIFQLPPMDGVPEVLAGRTTLSVRLVWTGDPDEGKRWFDEIRAVATPLLDGVTVLPYAAIDAVHTDPVDPMPAYERAALLHSFPAEAATALLGVAGPGVGSPQVMVELRQLGGAYAREGAHPTAFDHRGAAYSLLVVGVPAIPGAEDHADGVIAAMAPWDNGRVWPNFAPPHDAESAARAYDASTLARLREVVATYDPYGVLQAGAYTRA
jgi:FAD/FMN-containing dehydrogenase